MISSPFHFLANHLWQSTLFAAAAGVLVLALRKNRAQTRYWIWLAASVKFLIPFSLLVNVGSHFGQRTAPSITPPGLSYVIQQVSEPFTPPHPVATVRVAEQVPPLSWLPAVLCGVWVLGSATLIFSWWRRWRSLRATVRAASPLDLPIGLKAMISPAFSEPGIFGVRRPVLLLPAGITDRLTEPQFEAIVAHELCHVRRRDNLATAVQMGVEALFWFHPLVWWLGARLMEERERACDEEVLLAGLDAQTYAEGILKICELYLESPLPCVSGVTGANLRKRIEKIMSRSIGARLSISTKIVVGASAVFAVSMPIVVGIATVPGIALAQEARLELQKPLNFEAASVKRNPGGGPFGMTMGGPGTKDPGRIRYVNMSLKTLLVSAYGVNDFQIEGPDWMENDRFDIEATIPAGTKRGESAEMLRNLLVERFKIVLHRETKDAPGYVLVLGKNGPRLTESVASTPVPEAAPSGPTPAQQMERDRDGFPILPPGAPGMMQFVVLNRARLQGRLQTIGDLTGRLSYLLGHPVVDRTGLTAKYDFSLTFATEGTALARGIVPTLPAPTPDAAGGESAKDLFSAVQSQLGLKLEPKKSPMEVIVIDRAERIPVGN